MNKSLQCSCIYVFIFFQDKTILAWSKLKALADDKIDVVKIKISLLDSVENTLGKGENAGYQHFLLFLQRFPKPSFFGSLQVGIV